MRNDVIVGRGLPLLRRSSDFRPSASHMRFVRRVALVAAMAVPLAACGSDEGATAHKPATGVASTSSVANAQTHTYRNAAWHLAIDVPAGWTLQDDFTASYLTNSAWKTYAASQSQGTPVVALIVPGSNRIADAEIRIGASQAASEVRRCATPPDPARPGSLAHETIGGVEFATFTVSDAAMNHHLVVHAYRTVHDRTCYAIDLLVYGANPQVFDPPATPPFSPERAFTGMHSVLATFRFTH